MSTPEEREQIYKHYQLQKQKDYQELKNHDAHLHTVDFFEYCVQKYSNNIATVATHLPQYQLSYHSLNHISNLFATYFQSHKLTNQTIALCLNNHPLFIALEMGLSKLGNVVSRLNHHLYGDGMRNALEVCEAKYIVVGRELKEKVEGFGMGVFVVECDSSMVSYFDTSDEQSVKENEKQEVETSNEKLSEQVVLEIPLLSKLIKHYPNINQQIFKQYRTSINDRDPFCLIYTSGTTGPSKAARFSHRRFIGCALTWSRPSLLNQHSNYYITLPLYHGNAGAVALSPAIFSGSKMVIRRKFSVSMFWKEIMEFECSHMIYVGEVWRYIVGLKGSEEERSGRLKVIVGNGLGREIWERVVERYNIEREHYGSTEMPGDALLQYFNHPGACGYLPPSEPYAGILIPYTPDSSNKDSTNSIPRNSDGLIERLCQINEPGELLLPLPDSKYDGYFNNTLQNQHKLIQNILKLGDVWYRSGDLLKKDGDGFFYFVDRLGESYRWKGENVSSADVGGIISGFSGGSSSGRGGGVKECFVVAVKVKGYDGKTGCLIIQFNDGSISQSSSSQSNVDRQMKELSEYIVNKVKLPAYSIPIFARVLLPSTTSVTTTTDITTTNTASTFTEDTTTTNSTVKLTSTFKYQKSQYQQLGYAEKEGSLMYFWNGAGYQILTKEIREKIECGELRL